MSGSSLDGLDLIFVHFHEQAGKWTFEIKAADCYPYTSEWKHRLRQATQLSARDYCLLHTDYGHFLGEQVNKFVDANHLHMQMDLIASHGHTTFHFPEHHLTAQLGDGAAIAAETGVAVVSDLRNMDVALGGQGAPIVPQGEKLLFPPYQLFLNIGGIANISFHQRERVTAFDICPANRVLNELAGLLHQEFDEDGLLAQSGTCNENLLRELNQQDYYLKSWPKSLANEFGTEQILPLIRQHGLSVQDQLNTYVKHIAQQVGISVRQLTKDLPEEEKPTTLLVTGGGALNTYLISVLKDELQPVHMETVVPDSQIVNFKEALIMAFLGVLRWRENNTTLASVTGARRDSIGGALWMGQEGW